MPSAYVYEDDSVGWRHIQSGDVPSGAGSPLTTKGDLYGFDSANNRIPIGSNNQVLTADSTQTLGLKWATPAGSGITDLTSTGGTITVTTPTGPTTNVDLPNSGVTAGTYGDSTHTSQITVGLDGIVTAAAAVGISGLAGTGLSLIFDSTLSGAAASIDTGASSIAAGHQHLVVVFMGRGSTAAANLDNHIQFNNDSGANYDDTAGRNNSATLGDVHDIAGTFAEFGQIPGSTADANRSATTIGFLPSYDQTTFWKTMVYLSGFMMAAATPTYQNWWGASYWRSTASITRIKVSPTSGNYVTGTRLTVYGMQ